MQKFIEYAVNILFEEYTEGNPKILNFMKSRKLQFCDIERYSIGYIRPNNPTPKFVLDNADYYKEINLLSDKGKLNTHDRIIIPVKDIYGVFKMISCRDAKEYLKEDSKKQNKPSNSDSPAFQKYLTVIDKEIIKSEILHGYSDNLPYIRSANKVLLVEGQFDHVALDVLGCRYSVAISGSKIHEYFIELINKVSRSVKIVLALDNDSAGRDEILNFIISHPDIIERLSFIDWDVPKDIAKDPDEYTGKFGLQRFLALEKDAKYFVNLETMKLNDKVIFLHSIVSKCVEVNSIIYYYYYIKTAFPDVSKAFYISLLQKNLKTFENVGNFCYNAYYHKKRIHWFIERFCALWFIVRYKQRFRRYDKFDYNDRLLELSFYDQQPEDFKDYDQLKEIGEIFGEPVYSEGQLMTTRISSNYTEKILKRASDIYLKLKIKWIEQDDKDQN